MIKVAETGNPENRMCHRYMARAKSYALGLMSQFS